MNNPLNKTDPSGYIWATLASYAFQYIAANVATGAIATAMSYALTAYQFYGEFQLYKGIYNAIDGGGTAMANFAGGFAKSYVKGQLEGAVIAGITGLVSSTEKQGSTDTEDNNSDVSSENKQSSNNLGVDDHIKREQLTDNEMNNVKIRIADERKMLLEFDKALQDPSSESYRKLKENYGFRNSDFSEAASKLSGDVSAALDRLSEIENNIQKNIIALEVSAIGSLRGLQMSGKIIGLSTNALKDPSFEKGLLTHEIHHELGGRHDGMSALTAPSILSDSARASNWVSPLTTNKKDIAFQRRMQNNLLNNTYQFQYAARGDLR